MLISASLLIFVPESKELIAARYPSCTHLSCPAEGNDQQLVVQFARKSSGKPFLSPELCTLIHPTIHLGATYLAGVVSVHLSLYHFCTNNITEVTKILEIPYQSL